MHEYQFEDNFPLIGKNYYRLTSFDFDNYQETFKVIVKNYSGEKIFNVSPNSTDGETIAFSLNLESNEGQIIIYSMGTIVDSFQIDKAGEISFANSLKDGIYFAKLFQSNFDFLVRQ